MIIILIANKDSHNSDVMLQEKSANMDVKAFDRDGEK